MEYTFTYTYEEIQNLLDWVNANQNSSFVTIGTQIAILNNQVSTLNARTAKRDDNNEYIGTNRFTREVVFTGVENTRFETYPIFENGASFEGHSSFSEGITLRGRDLEEELDSFGLEEITVPEGEEWLEVGLTYYSMSMYGIIKDALKHKKRICFSTADGLNHWHYSEVRNITENKEEGKYYFMFTIFTDTTGSATIRVYNHNEDEE